MPPSNQSFPAELVEPVLTGAHFGHLAAVVEVKRQWPAAEAVAAVRRLVTVLPILGCRYEARFFRDRWAALADIPWERVVTVAEPGAHLEEATRNELAKPIAPSRECPLRVAFLNHPQGCRLLLTLPHLVADGNGVLSVLRELSAQLAGSGLTAPLAMNRSLLQIARAIRWNNLPTVVAELFREARRFTGTYLLGRWAPALPKVHERREAVAIRRVCLDAAASDLLVKLAKRYGATVNDVLVAVSLANVARRTAGRKAGTIYTINLRRYLAPPVGPIVANLSGVVALTLPRREALDLGQALPSVARATSGHKARLPGLASNLLPILLFGWMPHGMLRRLGRWVQDPVFAGGSRLAVMTNVGVMDPYVAPLGDAVADAWMVGPFVPGLPSPVSMATSFGGRLSVALCGHDAAATGWISDLAGDWQKGFDALARTEKTARAGAAAG